jgi:hypothetical protein
VTRWLRRTRGAIGIGLTWAAAWGGAGVMFSGVLGLVEGRRRLDQMSLARAATWGAAVGFLLSATFVLAIALAGDHAFLWNLMVLGPIAAVAAAGSAAGSLVLARRTQALEKPIRAAGGGCPERCLRCRFSRGGSGSHRPPLAASRC